MPSGLGEGGGGKREGQGFMGRRLVLGPRRRNRDKPGSFPEKAGMERREPTREVWSQILALPGCGLGHGTCFETQLRHL